MARVTPGPETLLRRGTQLVLLPHVYKYNAVNWRGPSKFLHLGRRVNLHGLTN
jgi:hypothetical protein